MRIPPLLYPSVHVPLSCVIERESSDPDKLASHFRFYGQLERVTTAAENRSCVESSEHLDIHSNCNAQRSRVSQKEVNKFAVCVILLLRFSVSLINVATCVQGIVSGTGF